MWVVSKESLTQPNEHTTSWSARSIPTIDGQALQSRSVDYLHIRDMTADFAMSSVTENGLEMQ